MKWDDAVEVLIVRLFGVVLIMALLFYLAIFGYGVIRFIQQLGG